MTSRDKEPETASVSASAAEAEAAAEAEPDAAAAAEAEADDQGVVGILKEGKSWYLTALLVFLLAAVGLVIYLAKIRSMDFLYALF